MVTRSRRSKHRQTRRKRQRSYRVRCSTRRSASSRRPIRTRRRMRTKRGAGPASRVPRSSARSAPYSKRPTPQLDSTSMDSLLRSCTEASENAARENKGGVYKACTDAFLALSYKMYEQNDDELPNEWYEAVIKHLKEDDYSNYKSLYFNILVGICLNGMKYKEMYPPKFFSDVLIGMEENAVTGMYDITHMPRVQRCLQSLQSPDDRFLSNTALIPLSKTNA